MYVCFDVHDNFTHLDCRQICIKHPFDETRNSIYNNIRSLSMKTQQKCALQKLY